MAPELAAAATSANSSIQSQGVLRVEVIGWNHGKKENG
ncbi:hypothetical protein AK973_0885 [Pseudomonas brassicacearum]|nr:hypothetical protein AK973_0885 [Pseudomonas brassicacearum]